MPDALDPLAQRLARFTPSTGMDRDALMFEAGRRSVRGRRAWPVVAALMAIGQAITVVVLWPSPTEGALVSAISNEAPSVVLPSWTEPSPMTEGIWSARTSFEEVMATPTSHGVVEPVDRPPLRPFSQLD